jgi:hypothetical protein
MMPLISFMIVLITEKAYLLANIMAPIWNECTACEGEIYLSFSD